MNILYGINTVTEALKARGRNFEWIGVAKERKDIRLRRVIDECRKIGVPVRVLSREELDEIAGNAAHQGLVAATSAKQYSDLDDLVASRRGEHSLIVVLDGIEDPHNLGAILRTADAAGADGVVIPERRSAAVTAAVAKVSAGASEHLPVAKVTNISRALEDLKEKDLWVVGLDERGEQTYDAVDAMMNWRWPGNIRELENFIERSVILSEGNRLNAPLGELRESARQPASEFDGTLHDKEREHIIGILRQTRGTLSGPQGAAARLGLKRTTLQYKMQRLGISRADFLS